MMSNGGIFPSRKDHFKMGHKKVTSRRMSSKAAKTLANPTSSKKAKSLAGSVLSQSRGKHKKK